MTLPIIFKMQLDEEIDISDIKKAIEDAGFDLSLSIQTHDRIENIELWEYAVTESDSE